MDDGDHRPFRDDRAVGELGRRPVDQPSRPLGAKLTRLHALRAREGADKRGVIARRRALGRPYLDGPALIDTATGIGSLELSQLDLFLQVRAEAYAMAERRSTSLRNKAGLQYLLGGSDFGASSAALSLAFSSLLLGPVCCYLGALPILFDIRMTRANPTAKLEGSQLFHLDLADATQVKVFIYLTPTDARSGPFTALPAELSARVVEAVGYVRGHVSDEQVAALVGPGRERAFVGRAGTAVLCDTARCLHFGGRVAARHAPRELLMFHYVLPTSVFFLKAQADGIEPRRMSHLAARDDATWNALIGVAEV
jgi:hypothetical protein